MTRPAPTIPTRVNRELIGRLICHTCDGVGKPHVLWGDATMCGIAGIFRWDGPAGVQDEKSVSSMIAALNHRGPDGSGVVDVDAAVVLGHTRLAILDLSEFARQPMLSDRWALTYNGEIYNFRELRAELTGRGMNFRSTGDTEVLLRALETFGFDAVRRVDGMFAFAAYDRVAKQLMLVRDRCGKKPLFYHVAPGRVTFASELVALRAAGIRIELDSERLNEYLSRGYVQPPNSPCRAVHQLEPAGAVTIDALGRVRSHPYWTHPWFDQRPRLLRDEDQVCRSIRDLFEASVTRRLVSDVPLGAFLSGGFDSAAVVAAAHAKVGAMRTFTIGFDAPAWNESAEAAETSALIGTEHNERMATPDIFELMPSLIARTGELQGDSSFLPTHLVSAFAREQVKVVLTGDGGDELFAGYDRFLLAAVAEASPAIAGRLATKALSRLAEGPRTPRFLRRVRRLARAVALGPAATLVEWAGGATFAQVELLTGRGIDPRTMAAPEFEAFRRARRNGAPVLHALLAANFVTYLPGNTLIKLDRATMATSLEARSPFLDTALINYASSLAPTLVVRGLNLKWIVKRALAPLVPEVVRKRRKRGFGAPVGEWFRGKNGAELVDRVIHSPRLCGHFDMTAMRSLCEAHASGRDEAGVLLFRLLSLDSWLQWAA